MSEEGEEVFHLGTKRLFQKSGRVKLLQLLMSEHSFFLPSGAVQKKNRDSQSALGKRERKFPYLTKFTQRTIRFMMYAQPCAADYGLHSINPRR